MDKMKDLKDLLRHEVLDLVSAEDQMIEGMPAMIEKATNPNLKKALREHLRITEAQRKRLDQVTKLLGEEGGGDDNSAGGKVGSFFTGLFGGGDQKCKAMEGLITEGNKVMAEDMNEEVMDAAIISSAQKIEHYEICGYGTARAFARELQLKEVERLLEQTLNEEYEADNRLTKMAVGGGINEQAEQAQGNGSKSGSGKSSSGSNKSSSGKSSSGSSSGGSKKGASGSSSSGKKGSGSSSSSGSKGASGKSSSGGNSSGKKSSSGGSSSSSRSSGSSGSGKGGASASKASSGSKGGSKSASGSNKSSGGKGGSSKGGGRGR